MVKRKLISKARSLQQIQIRPIKLLLSRNQKGILIDFVPGSGKTLIGLGFVMNYTENVIVMSPISLHTVWKNEIKSAELETDLKRFTFLDIANPVSEFKRVKLTDSILVVDEAHRLVSAIKSLPISEAVALIETLKKAKKILLLTGTPIYQEVSDIMFLINLAAGKEVVPFRESLFKEKYEKTNLLKSFFKGWLVPITTSEFFLFSTALIFGHIPMTKNFAWLASEINKIKESDVEIKSSWDRISQRFIKYSPMIDQNDVGLSLKFKRFVAQITNPLIDILLRLGFDVPKEISSGKAATDIGKWTEQIRNMRESVQNGIALVTMDASERIEIEKMLRVAEMTTSYVQSLEENVKWSIFAFTLSVLYSISRLLFDATNRTNVRDYDYQQIANDITQYVAFFDWKGDSELYEKYSKDYPSTEFINRKVALTDSQMKLWINWTYGKLSNQDLINMNLFSNIEEARLGGDVAFELNYYEEKGRVIGNIDIGKESSNKFKEILGEIRQTLKNGSKHITPSVIYSNFYESGCVLIDRYLTRNGVKSKILLPEQSDSEKNQVLASFSNGNVDVIILHPQLSEGVSIMRECERIDLHILEPIEEKAKLEQVSARVVRYKAPQKSTRVIQWISTIRKPQIRLKTFWYTLTKWVEWSKDTIYNVRFKKFDQSYTPDELVFAQQSKLGDFRVNLAQYFTPIDIADHIQLACEPWTATDKPGTCKRIKKK